MVTAVGELRVIITEQLPLRVFVDTLEQPSTVCPEAVNGRARPAMVTLRLRYQRL
jgi:hypothetical protein